MGRRYDEDVRVVSGLRPLHEDPTGRRPERFVWRGRLYLVEEVLSSWWERRAWWTLPERLPGREMSGSVVERLAEGADRRCWRVRARPGPGGPVGVYELALDSVFDHAFEQNVGGAADGGDRRASGSGEGGAWRLIAVGD